MSIYHETAQTDKHTWRLHHGDCIEELSAAEYIGGFDLALFDPPFGTGKVFKAANGKYYDDTHVDVEAWVAWFQKVSELMYEMLHADGQLLVQLDYRMVHEAKVLCLDKVFGRTSFLGEVAIGSHLGSTTKTRWAQKHTTMLHYAKNPNNFYFDYSAIHTTERHVVRAGDPSTKKNNSQQNWTLSSSDSRRVGFPTEKHPDLYRQMVAVHSPPGGTVIDPTAGSGTTGYAAILEDRSALLCELEEENCALIKRRLGHAITQHRHYTPPANTVPTPRPGSRTRQERK